MPLLYTCGLGLFWRDVSEKFSMASLAWLISLGYFEPWDIISCAFLGVVHRGVYSQIYLCPSCSEGAENLISVSLMLALNIPEYHCADLSIILKK